MKYVLFVNDDRYFGPSMMAKLLSLGERPDYVAIVGRFAPGSPARPRRRYLVTMLLTLSPHFLVSYLLAPVFRSRERGSLAGLLEKSGLPHGSWEDVNDPRLLALLAEKNIQRGFSVCSQIFSPKMLEAVSVINFHGGSLPQNRGRYPFFWAAYLKLTPEICAHEMGRRIDEGKLVGRFSLPESALDSAAAGTIAFAEALPAILCTVIRNWREGQLRELPAGHAPYRHAPGLLDILGYWLRGNGPAPASLERPNRYQDSRKI